MSRTVRLACVVALLLLGGSAALTRRRRIVGGEPASPPPPGASEAEDVVENPALQPAPPPPPPPTRPTSTTRRPAQVLDDSPIVFPRRGRREARVVGKKDPQGIYVFEGIRYAQPPTGFLRFQRPRRLKMEGDVKAVSPGPPCPQTLGQRLVGSEDCLFLNVYSPQIPTNGSSEKYPVLFWIHGGGFRRGSGSQYGVADLVKKGLVVVTIQYRLGSLGFLSTNRKELPGNAGLFDITASLRWVRHYVEFFGGDPDHIVPAGQGSGASAAIMLTMAHFTKSWLKGVFAMSGTAVSPFAVDEEPGRTADEVSAIDSCSEIRDGLAFVRCMQKLPLDNLVQGDNKLQDERLSKNDSAQSYITSISKLLNPGPAVEGEDDFRFLPNFLTATPAEILEKGDFARVPMLTGVTKHETSTSAKGGGLASKLLGQVEATEELLQKMIPKLLNVNSGLLGNSSLLNPVLGKLFSNNDYLKGITSSLSGVASALDKIIEMTTDALFNLPAFLTSKAWSKQSKAYLYSFEHESQTTSADDFLKESPLAEQPNNEAPVEDDLYNPNLTPKLKSYLGAPPVTCRPAAFLGGLFNRLKFSEKAPHIVNPLPGFKSLPVPEGEGVGHGDDLIYLFDVRSMEGQEVEGTGLTTEDDKKVRDHFTTLVAEFVRTGQPKVAGSNVRPFTAESGDYLVINSTPSAAQGFRKCQMGLWAGLADVLRSAECSFLQLGDVLQGLGDLTKGATSGLTTGLNKTAGGLTGGLNKTTGGLTGGLNKTTGGLTGGLDKTTGGLTGGLGGLLGGKGKGSTTKKPGLLGGLG